jgi:hypothetical protein
MILKIDIHHTTTNYITKDHENKLVALVFLDF